jgi:hypothetical protein
MQFYSENQVRKIYGIQGTEKYIDKLAFFDRLFGSFLSHSRF